MALVSQCKCEHPKLVHNKYTGKDVFVACGKCISCKRARQASWITKLQKEAKCHSYVYEVQLDYNERSLPRYDFNKSGTGLIEVTKRLRPYYEKFPNQKEIFFDDLKFESDADRNYFIDRLNTHRSCIPHASVYDVQLFKKRLNTLIKRKVTGKYQNFRSAFVSELGSTTLRPHMHGVLYFDDERLTKKAFYPDGRPIIRYDKNNKPYESTVLNELVIDAWRSKDCRSLGHAKVEPDRGSVTSYLAKYVCLPADIPSFYEHPALRPFLLTSRKPALGSLYESTEEIRYIFDGASPKRVEFVKQGELWCPSVFPIGQNIENRLFPKCVSYSQISCFDRRILYSIAVVNDDVPDFRTWCNYLFNRIFSIGDNRSCVLGRSYEDYIKRFFSGEYYLKDSEFARLIYGVTRQFENKRTFESLYTVSKRVFLQSRLLGYSLNSYITQIFKYHDCNKPQFILSKFYRTINDVQLKFKDYPYEYFYPFTYMSDGFSPNQAPDALIYFKHQEFKYNEEKKTKMKNAYFESLRKKDHPLFVLLQNYYHAKECNENVKAVS